MVGVQPPRYVTPKPVKTGMAFYWNVPKYWRDRGCKMESVPLGVGLGQIELDTRAKVYNDRFDGWRSEYLNDQQPQSPTTVGTVAWLFEEYQQSKKFLESVSLRSRNDYRLLLAKLAALQVKDGRTVGDSMVRSVSPLAADKIYDRMREGGKYRRAEKAVTYCKTAWKVVHRLHPEFFNRDLPNPWEGVAISKRVKMKKPGTDRDSVYRFAWAAVEAGRPEIGASAVICFEWLQRPENVVGGYIAWSDYRPPEHPAWVRVLHHKTGETIDYVQKVDAIRGREYTFSCRVSLDGVNWRTITKTLKPDDNGVITISLREAALVAGDCTGHDGVSAFSHPERGLWMIGPMVEESTTPTDPYGSQPQKVSFGDFVAHFKQLGLTLLGYRASDRLIDGEPDGLAIDFTRPPHEDSYTLISTRHDAFDSKVPLQIKEGGSVRDFLTEASAHNHLRWSGDIHRWK